MTVAEISPIRTGVVIGGSALGGCDQMLTQIIERADRTRTLETTALRLTVILLLADYTAALRRCSLWLETIHSI
jgi:hypothetical protein